MYDNDDMSTIILSLGTDLGGRAIPFGTLKLRPEQCEHQYTS